MRNSRPQDGFLIVSIRGGKDGIKMLAGLISFGSAFLLAGIAEGLYALAERAKDKREHKAIKELYERRMYRCGR